MLTAFLKSNDTLKKLALWMLKPGNDYRPRLWVRLLYNPFVHKRGSASIIRRSTRMDVFPYNDFRIGSQSVIEDFATVNNAVGAVVVGNNTIVGLGCVIIGPVQIGNNVMIAQNIVISGLNHGYEDVHTPPSQQKETRAEIIISDDVWIGANSVITAGVTLGKHTIIGAGSVVTKDIPPFSVAVGNPAKVIKQFNPESGNWERLHVRVSEDSN
ncbi:acyltransferase [Parapedobacter sp. DT-150]|uniref:acyltransferase n=1 Tax=Parapedobacter sp. DT-150 TaxID=3396162 RepID=UPI003F1C61AA